jgi:hexosaminidase
MSRLYIFLSIGCLVFFSLVSFAQHIIPLPQELIKNQDNFSIDTETIICYDKGLRDQAELLADFLSPATGWDFELDELGANHTNCIQIMLDDGIASEGYELNVNKSKVIIKGKTGSGIFYGIQTLLQLLPEEIHNKRRQKDIAWIIQGVDIKDQPEYVWRGMMLDVSRYFFDKDYVKKYIDMMAMYKMNTLHLHLIDDAGWRLEIKKYPRLTSVGAWRGEGEERAGGYYTQEDIKELVSYAALRNIDIIPEIEVPAHTLAAIAAYPYLSCNELPVKVQDQHSISRELYCVGKESTFEFLEEVLEEAFQLFPSKFIHIGGDEARYDRWKSCAHCQKRKEELGVDTEAELQVYFNRRMQNIAKKNGKTIVGWDEIIEDGLEEKAVGMVWHNKKKALIATELGHDIVLALTDHLYFDFPESNIPGEVKAATWMPPIPLKKVYHFDPIIDGLDEMYRPQILGAQGEMWSDQFIHGTILQDIAPINENRSEAYFDYLTFPRMSALAEVIWTRKSLQSWESFESRMKTHYNRYDEAGYGYRVPQPKLIRKEKTDDGFIIELENVVEGAEIRYTTDGIKANVYSEIYSEPIKIQRIQDFQAITVVNRNQYSLPLLFPVSYPQFEQYGERMGVWWSKDVVADQQISIERNATGKIKKNGTYVVRFLHTDGINELEINGITIYKNGRIIADDMHSGSSGNQQKIDSFTFKIDEFETGAAFKIKANIKGVEGNDSNGVIFINLLEKKN